MKMFNLIVIIFCLSHFYRGKNNKNEANTIQMYILYESEEIDDITSGF